MPDITIIKLKIRRGTDKQRKTIVLEQGEMGYTTDTHRVFVGDGITVGGIPVSNLNHPPIGSYEALTTQTNAVLNDYVYAGSFLYQLTASDYTSLSSWARISNNVLPDNVSIDLKYEDGKDFIKIKDRGITGSMFNSNAAYYQGGLIVTDNGLAANVDDETINITNNNQLSIYKVNHNHISNSSFANGINGGDGEKIHLGADPAFFEFDESNRLTLVDVPSGSIDLSKLNPAILGRGLKPEGDKIVAEIRGILPDRGLVEDDGNIGMQAIITTGDSFFKTLEYNNYGQIVNSNYSITSVLSCDTTSSELAIFNGSPSQIALGVPYTNQTIFTVLSASSQDLSITEQVVLSSAGFIMFEQTTAKDNMPVGRFAIPVFTY